MPDNIKRFRLEDRPGEFFTHVPFGSTLLGIHIENGRPFAYFNCQDTTSTVCAFEYIVSLSDKRFKGIETISHLGSVRSRYSVLHYFMKRKEGSKCQ